MTIRVIKRGEIPEHKPIQAACAYCKSLIEFLPPDVMLVSSQFHGDFYDFSCPVCAHRITVDKK